jgi:hypothetical protein
MLSIQSAVGCVRLNGDKAFPGGAPGSPLLLVRDLSNVILPDYSQQSLQPSGFRRPGVVWLRYALNSPAHLKCSVQFSTLDIRAAQMFGM